MSGFSESVGFASLVIVAAGRNERYGDRCKVLEVAGGRPLLEWSLRAAMACEAVHEVIVVTGLHSHERLAAVVSGTNWPKTVKLTHGGARRQDSVAAGVAMANSKLAVVLVHDGARPLASADLFGRCAEVARSDGAAIVATAVSDTLKRVVDQRIVETVSRDSLWAAQTPQGFRQEVLRKAMQLAADRHVEYTDEASMLESLGIPVTIVPGSRSNIKVTVPEDLELVDALLSLRLAGERT